MTIDDFLSYLDIVTTDIQFGKTSSGISSMILYQFRMYSEALSNDEMLQNYNAYKGGF